MLDNGADTRGHTGKALVPDKHQRIYRHAAHVVSVSGRSIGAYLVACIFIQIPTLRTRSCAVSVVIDW